jgi:putative ABC transport system permease protein
LVATEVAVALVLLVGAGLLLKSFVRLTSVDPGFRPDHLLTMQIQFPPSRPVQRAQSIAFFSELRERLAALPGVTAASAVSRLPALGGGSNTRGGNPFSIEGRTWSPSSLAHTPVVALDYFRTMQIPLIAGRIFTEADKADRNVAIVNETFTRLFFPNGDAIGHRVGLGGARPETPWSTIVGVVADVKTARLDQDTMPQIYFPHSQSPSPVMTLILRTSYDLPTTARAVAATINQLDPEMPVYDIKTMEERIAQSVGQPRFQTTLLAWFATVALFLAGIGIFGVVAHSTEQRTHEIGIRMALGADSERVLGYVVANGLRPVLIGLLIGIAGSLAAGRLLATALFHVTATDPVTFTLATVVLGLVAVMACLGPARKATRVDPMIALRAE